MAHLNMHKGKNMTQELHMGRRDEARVDRRLGFTAAQRKRIAAGVLLSYLCYPGVVLAQAAGVEAAANSPHAPQITQSQNQTTVVNINQASKDGVSRNQYNQFNVGPKGLILNNSTAITQTQLAGYIDGNAALKGQAARIILNEVVSANPSALRGYTEIAGQRAEFILANPNGISCNGCGFINTTRSTLTTGTAQFGANGGLTGFRVEGGQIAIEGQGLNASNVDQLDLLSRTIRINGQLWAKQLNLVTGRNTVDHASLAATPLAGADPAATGIALDVSAIGGMYANVIRMVGTEKGFGVNSQGQMIAEKDFTLAADGRITHSGLAQATQGQLSIQTSDVLDNRGTIVTGTSASITADALRNASGGVITAEQDLKINVTQQLNNEARIQAANAHVQVGSLHNAETGLIAARQQLEIKSAQDLNNAGRVQAKNATISAASINNAANAVLLAEQELAITTAQQFVNAGRLQAANAKATAGQFSNAGSGTVAASQSLDISSAGSLLNDGKMAAAQNLSLSAAGALTLTGTTQASAGLLTLQTDSAMSNTGVTGGRQVNLTAASVSNDSKGILLAEDALSINATGAFSNEGVVQATDASITAGSVRNTDTAVVYADKTLSIESAGTLDNQGALIAGGTVGALSLKARALNNTAGGVVLSFGDADIEVEETLLNASSTIEADGDLKLKAANIRNIRETFVVQERVTTNQYNNVAIAVTGKYKSGKRSYTETITTHEVTANSAAGLIVSGGDLTLLGSVDNIYSTISAAGDLHVESAILNLQDYKAVNSTVHSGTDSLKYEKKVCDRKILGKCVDSHKEDRTDKRSYNNTSNTQVTLVSAIVSVGNDLTGQVGELKNGMSVDALAQPKVPGGSDGESALPDWAIGDDGYKLPTSALVKPSTAPNGAYLVETDPRLTSYKAFISSDYMLSHMDYDPSITVKRLGDGFVEQRLVRDQLLNQTGQQNIGGFSDLEEQYVWLMQNAVSQSKALSLSMGIALSPEQINLLQEPIVWMVWETFETANGPQKALVPKVYLGNLGDGTDMQLRPDGALIAAGGTMSLTVAGKLENNGNLQAGNLQVDAGEILNKGDIQASGDMALSTDGDLVNQGGVITAAGALGLEVGGDLINETEAQRIANETRKSRTNPLTGEVREEVRSNVQTLVGREASISGGSVTINVGGDVRMTAANLSAQDQLSLTAGGDVEFKALETLTENNSRNARSQEIQQLTNEVHAGGNMTIQSGGKLLSEGTSFQAGGDMALAAREVELAAVTNSTESYLRMNQGMSGSSTTQQSSTSVVGNELEAGGNLSISSRGSIVSTASNVSAGGTLSLAAEGDVLLMAATERDYSYEKKSKDSNSFGGGGTKTTHTEETLSNVGNSLSGQNIQIQSGGLVHIHASTLDAEQDITLQAENIAVTAGIDQEYERDTKVSKTAVKVKSQDKGSMEQTAVASELNAANIKVLATGNVQITASNLNAEETLAIGDVAVQQQADGSFVAVNGEGTPQNLIVDTLALKSESWNEKSEGFRGIAADLMKGIAVVAGSIAQTLDMKPPEIKLGESSSKKETTISQQSSTLSAGDQLVLAAQNNVTLIGADVSTEGTAVLSAANVTLEAAAETSTSETSHSEHTVGGMGSKLNKDEVSLGGMKEVKTTETTTTTSTTHKGTTLNVGNLAVLATQDVNIVASKVEVEGQAIVQAGGDVNVTGKQDTTSTETRTDIETTTVAVAVRNAYMDAAMAAKAAKEAYEAAEKADKAYDDAKKRVDSGELAKAALKDYETNRDMARVAAAQAAVAAVAAIAGAGTAASQSMGTGFYVSGSAQKEVTSTSSTQTASLWQGSSIDAGSLVISGKNTTIEGSDITAGWLTLDSDKVLITAGIDQYKTETSSSTKSVTASGGTNGSASASASVSSSKSSSTSLENVNSRINVGHLESDADSFTLRGAEVITETADLNVGKLTIQSLQDTSEGSNSSKGYNVGVSSSQNKETSTTSQSVSVGVNKSSGSSESQEVGNQTQLLITDGANSQITAKDTILIGGLIANATQNKDGTLTDHGQLNLTTGTLTVSDLQDRSESEQSGWGLQTSTGRSIQGNKDGSTTTRNGNTGTTTVSMSSDGHKKEGETQATLGQGSIKVGGSSLDGQEQYADLNRDVNEGQITTLDQQTGGLNTSLTMDNRWLTEEGRQMMEAEHKKLAADVVTGAAQVGAAVTAAVADSGQISNAWNTVGKGQDLAYANNGQLAGETENLRDGLTKDAQTAQNTTNRVDQLINGGNGERVKMTDGTWAYGAVDESGKTIYVDMAGNRLNSVVNTVAHEGMHAKGANEATATVTGYMTDLAYRANAWANSEQIDANRPKPVATNSAASQQLLKENNAAFLKQAEREELEYRQLHSKETQWIEDNAQAFALQQGGGMSTEQAEARLAQQAFRQVQFGAEGAQDTQAQAFLSNAKNGRMLDADPNCPTCGPGYMFYATPDQRANANMYANQAASDPNVQNFYAQNGLAQPDSRQVTDGANKHNNEIGAIENQTIGAAGVAAALVGAPVAVGACLSNPAACVQALNAGGEIAAGDALGTGTLAVAGTAAALKAGGVATDAQFAQKTYRNMFSDEGIFAGKSVDEVAAAISAGTMKPSEVPIDYVVRDGKTIILNTRSAQALQAAGVPRSEWNGVNRTANTAYEGRLDAQLSNNPGGPFNTVRRSGGQ